MAELEPHSLDVAEEAATLADALVFDAAGSGNDAHWNEEARELITGLILTIVCEEPFDRCNLSTLREYLTLAPAAFDALIFKMKSSTAAGGLVSRGQSPSQQSRP